MVENKDFGKRVTCNQRFLRNGKKWEVYPFPLKNDGIFLGFRYLQQGYVAHEADGEYGEFEYTYWEETGPRIKAALVCMNAHTNPVYVPVDSVEFLND